MKQLKFNANLVPLILTGVKTTTWRLFDDKDLKAGDELEFLDSETKKPFTEAKVLTVWEKAIADLNTEDKFGHEDVGSGEDLIRHYEQLYKRHIDPHETVKVIRFEIKKPL